MCKKTTFWVTAFVLVLGCLPMPTVAQSVGEPSNVLLSKSTAKEKYVPLDRPNVLLISIDDLNNWVGYLARNNDDHLFATLVPDKIKRDKLVDFLTPNLDRLASQSVVFKRAHCPSPLCGPSRTSIFTGMHPSTIGYYDHGKDFRDSVRGADKLVTLPQHFKANGYETIEAGKVFHLSRGGNPNKQSRSQSDPQSWTAQNVNWTGVRWLFPPVKQGGKSFSGNPWRFASNTTAKDFREQGVDAELQHGQRWHQGKIHRGYFGDFFNFGPLPGINDKQYAPQYRLDLEQTFDYQQADYVATFLEGDDAGTERFTTDVAPGNEPTIDTVVPGVFQRTPAKPFFIAYGCFRPHDPFIVPKSYFDALEKVVSPDDLDIEALDRLNDAYYVDSSNGKIDLMNKHARGLAEMACIHKAILASGSDLHGDKLETWRKAVFSYLACIRFADDCVGRVLDGYEVSSEKNNTIVVLFSDHGLHLGTKEHWSKMTPWNEATHTPFMVSVPGIEPGVCGEAITTMNIFQTLLELAGLPDPDQQQPNAQCLEGDSLVPLLQQPSADWEAPAIISYKTHRPPQTRLFVAVDERFRLIRYAGSDEEEFYDSDADPREINNLSPLSDDAPTNQVEAYKRLAAEMDRVRQQNNAWPNQQTVKQKSGE